MIIIIGIVVYSFIKITKKQFIPEKYTLQQRILSKFKVDVGFYIEALRPTAQTAKSS